MLSGAVSLCWTTVDVAIRAWIPQCAAGRIDPPPPLFLSLSDVGRGESVAHSRQLAPEEYWDCEIRLQKPDIVIRSFSLLLQLSRGAVQSLK